MVGPRFSAWFENAPEEAWRPSEGGIDFVVLSLKEGIEDEIQRNLDENLLRT